MVATLAVTLGSSLAPAEAQGGPHLIEGTVLGPDGEPIEGVTIHATGVYGEPSFGPWTSAPTDTAGAFSLDVPDGSYIVQLARLPDDVQCRLGYVHANHELSYHYSDEERIVISGADLTALTIVLPGTLAELCKPIQGTILDADDKPMAEQGVVAVGVGPLRGAQAVGRTGADGTFEIYGPPGQYQLRVATAAGNACIVADHPDPRPGQRATIAVDDVGASGLAIVITGDSLDTPQFSNCFFPYGTVTTELLPGWNLGGWTEQEAGIEALFDEIPGLDIAHVWDAGEQRFRSAFDSGSQVLGDLDTLTPGMGLWLYVGGTEPVEWTRPLLPESGFVTLAGGWNLVAWSGRDGASGEEALTALSGQLVGAAVWDARRDQLLHHPTPNSASGSALHQIKRGEAVWLRISEGRHWLQPGSAQPPITYAEGISAATKAAFPPAAEAVLASFAEQYGVFVPTVSFRIDNSIEYCGFYQGRAVYLREVCLRAVAHEYVHAIQAHLSGTRSNPAWITEGMANRWSALYYDSTGDRTYEDHIQDVTIPNARLSPVSLEQLEETLAVEEFFHPNYSVAHLAVDWLVQLNGEDRFLEYYRNRSAHNTWEEAFFATFGIAVEDYYESFEEHRKEIAPPTAILRIEGTVTGADGRPLEGLAVRAFGSNADAGTFGPWTDSSTSADGEFSIHVPPDGSYLLQIFMAFESAECVIGYYGADAQRGAFHTLTRIAITDADITGIAISISTPISELCRRIEGTVIMADGTPLGITPLAAFEYGLTTERPTGATAQDGAFTLYGRDGTYHLGLSTSVGRECTVSGYATGESGGDAIITVDGGDVTGLRIVVSGGPTSSPELLRCTFAE